MGRRAGLTPGEPLTEMKLVTGGKIFGGAEALAEIARGIWWAWPLYVLSRWPGVKSVLPALYRAAALRRDVAVGSRRRAHSTFFEMP